MSVKYFNVEKLRQDLALFDKAITKVAFTPQGPPPPPMTAAPPPGAEGGAPPMGPDGQPMDPNAMPPLGGPPMGPDGQPMDPNAMPPGGAPPMGPDGQPMPPDGGMPPGGVDPQLEGMLSELANGVTGMGNEVLNQRDLINQLTQRLLQMEQQMSSLQDGLKNPAPMEQASEEAPIPGQPL